MAILVTGGAGFIGSHLIEGLLRRTDERIVCLDNFNDYYDPRRKRLNVAGFANDPRVTVVEDTFCSPPAVDQLFAGTAIERVVHLGAYAGVRASIERPLVYQKANVEGTLTLLEVARQFGVKRFLIASSSTVYGREAVIPFREDAPLGIPMSPYGATKRAAELIGLTYWNLHRLPVVCLRLFSVYGPRLRPDLAMFIFTEAILSGERLPLFGDGSIRRDFTHVDDICAGIEAALFAEGIEGQAINLGAGRPITMRRLIGLLEDAAGRKAIIDQESEKPGEMPETFADVTRARERLAYEPQMPIEEGVRQYVAWHRQAQVSAQPNAQGR